MAGRPLDPAVTDALLRAALDLLAEQGFARMTMEAVAERAQVGKPALYRRFRDKPALVVAAIDTMLPPMVVPDLGDSARELRLAWAALPEDIDAYLVLIGGLAAERPHHPELLDAFRRQLLLPRRATVVDAIRRAQGRGDLREDVPAETALDLLAGPILARGFAGRPTGPAWRRQALDVWLRLLVKT